MPNVQNTISYENPLKIAQHHNFDNVESFTFYVHTSMYKSEQALWQARILSGDLWIYSRVFLCVLFFAQYLNNLLQTPIHHRSCAMKAFWQNFKAEIRKHCERDKGPKKPCNLGLIIELLLPSQRLTRCWLVLQLTTIVCID